MSGTLEAKVKVRTTLNSETKRNMNKAISTFGFDLIEFIEEAIGFNKQVYLDYFIAGRRILFYQRGSNANDRKHVQVSENIHRGADLPIETEVRPVIKTLLDELVRYHKSDEARQLRYSLALYADYVNNIGDGYTALMVDEGEIARAPVFLSPTLRGLPKSAFKVIEGE